MFKIIPLLSDQCAPQLHCLPSGGAPDAACSFTGGEKKPGEPSPWQSARTRRGREGGRERERKGEMFPKIREEGNYFKGWCCCCVIKRRSSFFSVMRLISAAFDGRIEKTVD